MAVPPGAGGRAGERADVKVSLIAGVGALDAVRMYRGEKIVGIAEDLAGHKINRKILGPPTAIDVYYSLYLPVPILDPSLVDAGDPADLTRYMILERMMKQPLYHKVRLYTVADPLTSVVAAASIIERLDRMLEKSSSSGGSGSLSRSASEGEVRGSGHEQRRNPSPEEIEKAVAKALKGALKDASAAKEVKAALARLGAGVSSILAFDDSPEEILRLARETDVTSILRYLVGLKVSFREERRMTRHSRGWLRGLEYGSDLERLHPSQLALPDDLFYTEFAHDRLLLFEKALPSSRGPIYVLLDKSGSMIGDKIDWARAVAVALLQKSIQEKRPFYARFFDSTVYPLLKVKRFNRSKEILNALNYLARVKAGGGTRITAAVYIAMEDIRSQTLGDKVSDVVLITDGEDKVSTDLIARAKRAASARLHTVMVKGDNHYLRKVSDNYMEVRKSLDGNLILEVVDFIEKD